MNEIITLQKYCQRHGLIFKTFADLAERDGEEEWEGIKAAGMYDGDICAPAAVVLKDDDTFEVVAGFADGIRRMEDAWEHVTPSALESGKRIHAV